MIWSMLALVLAGKLADDNGFRGLKFGPDTVLAMPPMEGCLGDLAPTARWACPTTIGGQPVKVYYMAEHGWFSGVLISGEGYASCYAIKDVLTEAWGTPRQDNQYIEDYRWTDGRVLANFEFEEGPDTCTIIVTNRDVGKKVEAAEKDAAKKGVGDL